MLVFGPEPPPPMSPAGAVVKRIFATSEAKAFPSRLPRKRKVPRFTRSRAFAVRRALTVKEGVTTTLAAPSPLSVPTVSVCVAAPVTLEKLSSALRSRTGVASLIRLLTPVLSPASASLPPCVISNAELFRAEPPPLRLNVPAASCASLAARPPATVVTPV